MTVYAFWVLDNKDNGEWIYSWLLYSIPICIGIFLNFVLIYKEGCGYVNVVYRYKLILGIFQSLVLLLSLYFGAKLYSLGFSAITSVFLLLLFFRSDLFYLYKEIRRTTIKEIKIVVKKILPFQIKLSIVWISGYLYWNFYNIYLYKEISIELSAMYGITNAAIGAISFAMLSILQTKRNSITDIIFNSRINATYSIFFKSIFIGVLGYILLSIIFLFICFVFHIEYRILPLSYASSFICLRLLILINEYILVYLRCFREEPLAFITVFNYVLTPLSSILSVYIFGVDGFFVFPIISQSIFLVISIYKAKVFVSDRNKLAIV
ncbi:TPA: hypothetical protein ACX6RC_003523 [Photobacterium damselae]